MRPVTPVSIAAARLGGLLDGLADGELGEDGVATLREVHAIIGGLDPYLERSTTPESNALAQLSVATREADWDGQPASAGRPALEQEMLSGHVEGQLLKMLVHATRARLVLDIGMFTGYSALAMAEALPDGGRVVACEVSEFAAQIAREGFARSPVGDRVEVRLGPALQTLRDLTAEAASFDLVFIDADKAGYLDYVHALLDGDLLAPHALICVDNTLMQGQPWSGGPVTSNGEAITAFNKAIVNDGRVEQVVLPVRDGLTLIRRAG